jgi:membrane protein
LILKLLLMVLILWLQRAYYLYGAITTQFMRSNGMLYAASLAFFSLLALLPITLIGVVVFSHMPWALHLGNDLHNWLFQNLIAESAQSMQVYFDQLVAEVPQLSIKGYFLIGGTSIMMLFNLEGVYNQIWCISKARHSFIGFIVYAGAILSLPILLASVFFLKNIIINYWQHNHYIIMNVRLWFWVFSFWLTTVMFTLMNIFIPNCRVSLRAAFYAAILTSTLFILAKYLFTLYFEVYTSYTVLYGAMSMIPAFLLWLYTAWVIILLGACCSYVLTSIPSHER